MEHNPWRAVHACQDLATRFYHNLDRNAVEAVAAAFASDGVWVRQNGEARGRGAILDVLRSRPADTVTRHLLANVVVDLDGEEAARISYELSVFVRHGDAAPRLQSVLTGEDHTAFSAGHWLFTRKRAVPLLSLA